MNPTDLRYNDSHQWVRLDDNVGTIGITNYAQDQLGDIVYVELPQVGDEVGAGDSVASVESVKAVSDVYSPISGEVAEVNEALADTPEMINQDCYGEGWLIKIKLSDPSELTSLMSAEEYQKHLSEASGG